VVKQTDLAVNERQVSVRPAPGGMAYLSALLPMKQAVACLANLKRSAATTTSTGKAVERTQHQVMANLLVERVTGQRSAEDVPVEVHLVMTDRALFGADETPVWLVGHGPLSAGTARRTIRDTDAEVFLRRPLTGTTLQGCARRATTPRRSRVDAPCRPRRARSHHPYRAPRPSTDRTVGGRRARVRRRSRTDVTGPT
jgi:hypothetical protein